MISKQTYDELLAIANLAQSNGYATGAEWLHNFVSGSHKYPTLAIFEHNIDGGDLRLECLTKGGVFLPCFVFKIEAALDERYRFPPLFRVAAAGHMLQSNVPSDLRTPQ